MLMVVVMDEAFVLAFTVLAHTGGPDGDHFDFLVELEPGRGDLLTFRLPRWPVLEAAEVRRLRDHRRLYLTYQGPISEGRGSVAQVARGKASVSMSGGVIQVGFATGGKLEFHPQGEDRYVARWD